MIGYSRDTPMLRLDANGIHSDHIHWFLERFDQAYIDELKVFVDGIVDDTPLPVDGHDARAAWCSPTPPRRHSGRMRRFRPRGSRGLRVMCGSGRRGERRSPAWPSPPMPTRCS